MGYITNANTGGANGGINTSTQNSSAPVIDTPEKAAAEFAFIKDEMREHFVCITLDAANRKIALRVISIGTLTASLVHPREVFADAITDRAASIIVGHNHPSGSLEPSNSDLHATRRIKRTGDIIGIPLRLHVILTKNSCTFIK